MMRLLPFLLAVSVLLQSSRSTAPSSEAQSWFQQARQYFEKQQWEESRSAAMKALEIDPALADAEVLLGLAATAQARLHEAERHLLRAVSLQPQNDRAQGYLALVYLQQKRLAEAREDRKSTRLNSSHTVISYAVFCLKKKKKNNEC